MKRLLLLLLTVVSLSCAAQNAFDFITKNRNFSASNYCIYPDSIQPQMTPPPAGKQPFYISHYGRHGSRYLSNRKGYDIPYNMLCKADSMNQLTPIGSTTHVGTIPRGVPRQCIHRCPQHNSQPLHPVHGGCRDTTCRTASKACHQPACLRTRRLVSELPRPATARQYEKPSRQPGVRSFPSVQRAESPTDEPALHQPRHRQPDD